MADQFTIQQQIVVGLNSLAAPDTAVTPTRALTAISIEPQWRLETEEFTPRGSKVPTIQNVNVDESSAGIQGKAEFHELGLLLASLLVGDDGTNTGVAIAPVNGSPTTAKIWDFLPKIIAQDTPQPFTSQFVGDGRGMQMDYCLVTDLTIGADAKSGISLSGQMIGRQLRDTADGLTPAITLVDPIPAAFTSIVPIQVRGNANCVNVYLSKTSREELGDHTTVALDYDATATEIQTALRDLAPIDGANVAVTGSVGGPFTITFGGTLAARDVPLIEVDDSLLTGGTNPRITLAETVKGASPATDEVQTLTILGTPTGGTFTLTFQNTKLRRVQNAQWKVSGRWEGFKELDCAYPSWSIPIEKQMNGGVSFSLGQNDQSMGLLREIRGGERVWVRVEIMGPTIGIGPDRYKLRMDSCVFLKAPGAPKDMDGLMGVDFDSVFARDDNFESSTPGFTAVRLVNTSGTLL